MQDDGTEPTEDQAEVGNLQNQLKGGAKPVLTVGEQVSVMQM